MSNISDQTIALASMMQSAVLIDQLANKGTINKAAFDCSMDSLFSVDADSTHAIFGNVSGLIVGLRHLQGFLAGTTNANQKTITYYILSMFKLEKKLRRMSAMAEKIQNGFLDIDKTSNDFGLSDSNRIGKIDNLYQETISQIKPRIMVQGEQSYLTNQDNTSKVRTLLFAGIRAAVLWHQVGGSRWRLLFSRKKYLAETEELLRQFEA